jgi:hypothetical protein
MLMASGNVAGKTNDQAWQARVRHMPGCRVYWGYQSYSFGTRHTYNLSAAQTSHADVMSGSTPAQVGH